MNRSIPSLVGRILEKIGKGKEGSRVDAQRSLPDQQVKNGGKCWKVVQPGRPEKFRRCQR